MYCNQIVDEFGGWENFVPQPFPPVPPPQNTFTHPNLGSTYLTAGWKPIHAPSDGWIRTPSIIKERICGYKLRKSSQQILHQSSASSGRRLAEEALPWFLQGLFRAKAEVSGVWNVLKKPVSKGMDFIVKESLRAVSSFALFWMSWTFQYLVFMLQSFSFHRFGWEDMV